MRQIPDSPSVTFVFCAESGYFEVQTVLSIESLRHFGGRFANAPVLVITPRIGPNLTRETLRRFDELGVTYIRSDLRHPLSWYCYMNKALSAMLADEYVTTEQLVWMDSDTLIVQEPELLWLEPEIDFAICSIDKNVGSSGPQDRNETYWSALCDDYGISIDQLPWVTTETEQEQVRFRLHSGVYVFRRGVNLGKAFVKASEQMLTNKIAYSRQLPFPGDDVALAFAVVLEKLRWQMLPMTYNYEMTPTSSIYKSKELPSAKILHYHHVLTNPAASSWFLNEISGSFPEVHSWLKDRVPLNSQVGGKRRSFLRRLLKEWRGFQQRQVESACRVLVS